MKTKPNPTSVKIKSLLHERKKTQRQLAEHMGLSESALSHLFSRGTFNRDTMIKIAKFFNVDLAMFNQNSQVKSPGAGSNQDIEGSEDQVQHLQKMLEGKEELLRAKDDLIRAKDEIIATLKEKTDKK